MRVTIGFSRGPGVLSRTIRWALRSEVSHVFFVVRDPLLGTPLVWEAGAQGFRPTPAVPFFQRNVVVLLAFLSLPYPEGAKDLGKLAGAPYDVPGLFGGAFVALGRWAGRKWRNPFRGSRALFCSEAVSRLLRATRFPDAWMLDPDSTLPDDLLRFVRVRATGIVERPSLSEVSSWG